jgi:hypothetical protein
MKFELVQSIKYYIIKSHIYNSILFTILAGIPAKTILSSLKDLFTTAFAPIITLLPSFIGPKIFTPGPIYTLSPMIGAPPLLYPILTHMCIRAFFPILEIFEITIVPKCGKDKPSPITLNGIENPNFNPVFL